MIISNESKEIKDSFFHYYKTRDNSLIKGISIKQLERALAEYNNPSEINQPWHREIKLHLDDLTRKATQRSVRFANALAILALAVSVIALFK